MLSPQFYSDRSKILLLNTYRKYAQDMRLSIRSQHKYLLAQSVMHEKRTKEDFKAIIESAVGVSYKPSLSRFDLAWKHFEVESWVRLTFFLLRKPLSVWYSILYRQLAPTASVKWMHLDLIAEFDLLLMEARFLHVSDRVIWVVSCACHLLR